MSTITKNNNDNKIIKNNNGYEIIKNKNGHEIKNFEESIWRRIRVIQFKTTFDTLEEDCIMFIDSLDKSKQCDDIIII